MTGRREYRRAGVALLVASALFSARPVLADAAADLETLLDEFLANVASIEMHDRFWADDLVYTSSNGTRTSKQAILAEMRAAAADDPAGEGDVRYDAEAVDIRVYGDAAVVAFRLVATGPGDAQEHSEYFNTGTFVRRDGRWQAVAWQATRIPPAAQ
jgi:Domain of unknown function (DUF4440)